VWLLQIYMTFTHDDDISNLCTLVPILSEPLEKEYVSQASQGSGKTTASCKGRRGRPPLRDLNPSLTAMLDGVAHTNTVSCSALSVQMLL
jgi:hypothetical protein